MKILTACFLAALLLATALLADEEEVAFTDLIAKPADYDGKTVKLNCQLLFAGSEVLAVAEVTDDEGILSFEGEAVLLKKVKSSEKKKLTKGKYNKRTSYHGPAEITGEVKVGEFGRKKQYKLMITVKEIEIAESSTGEFKVWKKNKKNTADLPSENAIGGARQAVRRDGFNPPTYPKYHDGSSLSDNTQVLCITDGKESKVYTIGSLGTCELVNDKIGKIPLTVTW